MAAVAPAQPLEVDRQIAKVSLPSISGNLTQPAYEMDPGRLGWKLAQSGASEEWSVEMPGSTTLSEPLSG